MTDLLYNILSSALAYIKPTSLSDVPVTPQSPLFPQSLNGPSQAHRNLCQYAKSAVLPEMALGAGAPPTPRDRKTSVKNPLIEKHELHRRFEVVHWMYDFDELACVYTEANVPSNPTENSDWDVRRNSRISIPIKGYDILPLTTGEVTTFPEVIEWIRQYPLTTVRRMMHSVYPETTDYKMEHIGTPMDRDKGIMECFKWCADENIGLSAADYYRPTVMIFVQPPWMLASHDMDIFSKTQKFPDPRDPHKYRMRSYERIWSKIYDGCKHSKTNFFVLTTYHDWVFGAFSEERTQAWISPVKTWDTKGPTVVESLFYWLSSATFEREPEHCTNPWFIPKVYEPIYKEVGPGGLCVDDLNAVLGGSIADEDWEVSSNARSHDPSMQVSDDEDDDDDSSVTTTMETDDPLVSRPSRVKRRRDPSELREWVVGFTGAHRVPPPPQSEVSGYTASSASTVRDYASAQKPVRAGSILTGQATPSVW